MENTIMKKLNRTDTAVFLTVILILLAFVIGGTRPLNKLRREADVVFYKGSEAAGPDAFDISADIDSYIGLTYNIQTVAARYGDSYKTLSAAIDDNRQPLKDKASHETAGASLNQTRTAAKALYDALINDGALTAEDKSLLARNWENMESRYIIIQREGGVYNEKAQAFNDKLKAFPAWILKSAGLVKPLELFYNK